MPNKILDLVYRTHCEGKEKTVIMTDFLIKYDRTDLCEESAETLKFFDKHIPIHFAYEELVINALLDSGKLEAGEATDMKKILDEHGILKKNFDKIQVMASDREKIGPWNKEEFARVLNETLAALLKHAEFEDKSLFPLAERKLDENTINALEKEMLKIIY